MYDTVKLYLNSQDYHSDNLLYEVNRNEGTDYKIESKGVKKGVRYMYISVIGKNNQKLTFKVTEGRLSMTGRNSSICKYYLGNNFDTLTLEQFQDAIIEISKKIGIGLFNAQVSRFDLATNFITNYKPNAYHTNLIHLPRHSKDEINGNLYFRSNRIELNFYDKKKEYIEKGYKIPKNKINKENVLRYEIRFKKHIPKVFKQKVTINDLCSYSFYEKAYNKWQHYYNCIHKQNNIIFDESTKVYSSKHFKNHFLLKGYESTGGIKAVYDYIDKTKKEEKISSNTASYLRKTVNKVYEDSKYLIKSDLVGELDSKILNHKTIFHSINASS